MDRSDTYINYRIDMEATGRNIRNLISLTGYSARELEKIIGATQMAFFNWQEGKNLPNFDNLLRLSGILKTPIEKIVVFEKIRDDSVPLKESNSGAVRNNVFFTYNNATHCVIRDAMAFKKKYGMYPDRIVMNRTTLSNWQQRETEEAEEQYLNQEYFLEPVPGQLVAGKEKAFITAEGFTVDFIFDEKIPTDYYRLIKSDMVPPEVLSEASI